MLDKFQQIIDENEKGTEGGYFPLGKGYTWHSGIHLYGKTVRPLLSGEIVAYRQTADFKLVPRKTEVTKDEYYCMPKEEAELYQLITKEKNPQKNATNIFELRDGLSDEEKKEKAGSNFYLIKHSFLENKLNFYTLYNHLYPDELKYKNEKEYFDATTDLRTYEMPITYKFKYKFVKKQTNTNMSSILPGVNVYPGSWFTNKNIKSVSEIESIFQNTIPNYSVECIFDSHPTPLNIQASKVVFKTANIKIENKKVYQSESNKIYNADNTPTIVGTYSMSKKTQLSEIYNPLKIQLKGESSGFTKDSSYINTHVLIPTQYLGTKLQKEDNIYSLRYKDKKETIYAVSLNVGALTKYNCPLEYSIYNTANIRVSRLINNEIVVLNYDEFKKLIEKQLDNNKCLILICDDDKRIIISSYILSRQAAFSFFAANNYQLQNGIKNEYIIPVGSIFNKSPNNISSESKFVKSNLLLFLKLPVVTQQTNWETKIFFKGKHISPISLETSVINNWQKVINTTNNIKFEFNDIIIFQTKPINTYKKDSFILCPSEYKDIQLNGGYSICKRYIQNSVSKEYIIKKDDIKIEELHGRILGSINKDNLMLYNNLDESDIYGCKNPLLEKNTDCEFNSQSLPLLNGTDYKFNSIDIGDGNKYSAVINKSQLQIKITQNEETGIKIDDKIHFCKIPVNENDILGFPCADKDNLGKKQFYDTSLFLENNFMSEKIKGIDKQFYIYQNMEADKVLYENDLTAEKIFFPEGTVFSLLFESKVNNKTAYKIDVKEIPVFLNKSDVEKDEQLIHYQFDKKPDVCFLDNHKVKNDRPETLYCFNVIDSIYENYKNKDLDYIGKDPVNGKEYNAYYFSAEDLKLSTEFWILENTFKQINKMQTDPLVLESEIEIKDNIEAFIYYNENPFLEDKKVELIPQTIYIPIKTKLIYLENYEGGKNKAYKIKFSKIPLTIHNNYIKELDVKYKIKNTPQSVCLNEKKITKESDGEFSAFANGFFEKIDSLKLKEYDFYQEKNNMIGVLISGKDIFSLPSIWCTKEVIEDKENWSNENTKIGDVNQLKKDLSFKYFNKDPLYIYKKDHKVIKESKIIRIDDTEVLQDLTKQNYFSIELAEDKSKLYISELEASKYRTDATEWKKFFNVCETDSDEDILSNIQDLESVLNLTDKEKTDLEKIINDVNELVSKTDKKTSEIAEIYKKDTETKKTIVEKLRTLNVTHIHELELKAYDFMKDDKSMKIDYEYLKNRCTEVEIWNKIKNNSGFSKSECKNIKCKKNLLTFVHPVYFLNHLEESGILNIHAKELLNVQKAVMNLKCLEPGGVGPKGDNTDEEQTWCNIAVYLTIRALDKNYKSFLINSGEPAWFREEYKNIEPWKAYSSEYSSGYRTSNFWCDVLSYKAIQDDSSSIRLADNYTHAQNLANKGKVVIAAWKNPNKTKNASPHFVTVLPGNKSDSLYKLKVANVGIQNGELFLEEAFHSKKNCDEVKFYYNDDQDFICNLDAGKGQWFTSINELKEIYNK